MYSMMLENVKVQIDAKMICTALIIGTEIEDSIDEHRLKLARKVLPLGGAGLDAIDDFRRDTRKRIRTACERNLKNL